MLQYAAACMPVWQIMQCVHACIAYFAIACMLVWQVLHPHACLRGGYQSRYSRMWQIVQLRVWHIMPLHAHQCGRFSSCSSVCDCTQLCACLCRRLCNNVQACVGS